MTLHCCGAGIHVGLAKCNKPESRQPWLDEGSSSVFGSVWELAWLQLPVSCLHILLISHNLLLPTQA